MAEDSPAVDAAEQLFDLPAADFVAARDDLVRRLKAGGDREEADRVKAMRRPTLAAWAVNQVVRQHPDHYVELVDAGAVLQRAMRKAMSGVADSGIREATATRRGMVEALTDRAAAILADSGARPDSHLDDVAATFEAASAAPGAAEQVAEACLSAPLAVPADFGAGMVPLAVSETKAAAGEDDDEGIDPEVVEQRRAAMRTLEAANSRAEKSAAAARDARNEAAAVAERATRARTAATEARRAAEQAEAEAAELDAGAQRAELHAEEAATTAERDAEAAEEARAALADLA